MTGREIDGRQLGMAFAEITSLKLVVAVLLQCVIDPDDEKGRAEIDHMIQEVRKLAFRGVVDGAERESSDRIMKVAEERAISLLNLARPKTKK